MGDAAVTRIVLEGRRAVGVRARIGAEEREFRAREVILSARRDLFARHPDALGNRAGACAAVARHSGCRRPRRCRRQSAEPSGALHRAALPAWRTAVPKPAHRAGDLAALFLGDRRLSAARPLRQRPEQDVVECARAADRQHRARPAQARLARERVAGRGRSARPPAGRVQFPRRGGGPAAAHAGVRVHRGDRLLGAGAPAAAPRVSGPLHRSHPPLERALRPTRSGAR